MLTTSQPHSGNPSIARIGGVFGLIAVVLNVLGIVALKDVGMAYKIGQLDNWISTMPSFPGASSLSALAFTFAVLTMIPYAWALHNRDNHATVSLGSLCISIGALMNAVGTFLPMVVVLHVLPACDSLENCRPLARGLLGYAITMDGLFNFLLGAGLLCIGTAWVRMPERRKIAGLGILAGLTTLPVSLQPISDACQSFLAVGGPLWLLFITITSVQLLREAK